MICELYATGVADAVDRSVFVLSRRQRAVTTLLQSATTVVLGPVGPRDRGSPRASVRSDDRELADRRRIESVFGVTEDGRQWLGNAGERIGIEQRRRESRRRGIVSNRCR